MRLTDAPTSFRPPRGADTSPPRRFAASSTASATDRWTRSWSAWWTPRCSTSASLICSGKKSRKPRESDRAEQEVRCDVGAASGGRAAILRVGRRGVVEPEVSARATSTGSDDGMDRGVDGVSIDAGPDALDYRDNPDQYAPAGSGDRGDFSPH